ncbi:diguanylate cyclase with GAF sensor [Caloramator quimbayensis]|uniref:Diguanylate cyclase with GAF sensor n=1 Tax=Caloramator quimbayensis TaxID=1147123 RepID=A0A1T4Y0H8_9CLOT|nr:diguanylate cyclase with GAF sensor [Caloramator quimbayensis]
MQFFSLYFPVKIGKYLISTYYFLTIINQRAYRPKNFQVRNLCYFLNFTYDYKILNIILISIGFVGIFLLINLTIIKIDISIEEGKYYRFDKDSSEFLIINLIVSILLTALLCIVHEASGIIGTALVLFNILITHYCLYIYRKLFDRNEAIKSLLKVTCDIVKYGDFRDKCKHLLVSLNELIPYTLCAIYTFDINNDNISYPVAYNSKDIIDIGDLGFNLTEDSITLKIVRQGKIYVCKDIKKDKKVRIEGRLLEIVNSMVLVPIVIGENVEGLILIGGDQELLDFTYKGIEDILSILSNQMALAIENDIFYRGIKNKAEVDSLTKLYNRRVFNREIEKLIKTNTNFSLVIYDIDNFKQINDTYGHLIGDEVLERISGVILKSIRKTDVACRYGGEEIVIIFKDLGKEDALIISERIRQSIESTIIHSGAADISVTVSGGVASFPEDGPHKEDIVGNADKVLYSECKLKGKNKVFAYGRTEKYALYN